jgi:hypothetical protein
MLSPPKKMKLEAGAVIVAALLALYVANYLFVYAGWSPFLWCDLGPVVSPLYAGLGGIINVIVICLGFFGLVTKRYGMAAGSAVVFVLVSGLPQFCDTFFRIGGSCAGG